jgi:UDP-N-acetylenolpyruvoylglucosamine reductase
MIKMGPNIRLQKVRILDFFEKSKCSDRAENWGVASPHCLDLKYRVSEFFLHGKGSNRRPPGPVQPN